MKIPRLKFYVHIKTMEPSTCPPYIGLSFHRQKHTKTGMVWSD